MVSDILNELSRRGIKIELAGEKIRLHGPSKDDFDVSLVELIKAHKTEIIATLTTNVGTDLKGRPIWCTECDVGDYRDGALWCGLADKPVLEMRKCVRGYWTKNGKGFPTIN